MIWILVVAGLVAGVFINICADSLPTKRHLHRPTCAMCQQPRPLLAWSGLVAYASRHDRCPHCSAPLSIRHVLVELATPALFVFCWTRTGSTVTTLFNILYSAAFVLILTTDIEHRLILHVVSLPSIALALIGAYTNPVFDSPSRALLGGGIGLSGALLLYLTGMLFGWWIGKRRGEPLPGPAFGFGDVTLSAFLGLVVGVPDIIFAIVIGICAGFVAAMLYLIARGLVQREHKMFTAFIPYGPFLILGGAVMLYFGQEFMAWYTGR
jgi:leader peptidase (prepilin peptidase)/N-methyltransferase